eukprot:8404876-Pyramimonas_sp.AAC.1
MHSGGACGQPERGTGEVPAGAREKALRRCLRAAQGEALWEARAGAWARRAGAPRRSGMRRPAMSSRSA